MFSVDDQNPVARLRVIWNGQHNPPQNDVNNIKLILASTKICRENIESICQLDDQIRNHRFSDIFYSSPLFDTYIQDLLYQATLIQYDDQNRVREIYREILRLLQKGGEFINLSLKDIINYNYLLIGNKRNEMAQIIRQINEFFDSIFIDQQMCPSQVTPVFKFMDLFKLERYDFDQEYEKAYSVLKENTSQGLRDAVLSLLRTGIKNIHQYQTRLANIFTNMKFKRIKINHLNLRFIVTAKPSNTIIRYLQMKDEGGKLAQAQKEYLKRNSLIVVTNQFHYSYFELYSVKWDGYKPYLQLKALDLDSVINFIKIINSRGQTIILESQSSYYQNQDYLAHLIKQNDPAPLRSDIQSYLVNPPNIIITAQNNSQQIDQIVQQINLRFNVVFKCPGTNENILMERLIQRESQLNKILFICQSNVVRRHLIEPNENVGFIQKVEGRGNDQQSLSSDLIQVIKSLLYQMIIPDYEITVRDMKLYAPQIFNNIISQYCLLKRLSQRNLCENCRIDIVQGWLEEQQFQSIRLQCRCNIQQNQNVPRWQNRNQNNLTTSIKKIRFQPSLQSNNTGLSYFQNNELDPYEEYNGSQAIIPNNQNDVEQFDDGSSDDGNEQSDDESDHPDSDDEIFDLGENLQYIPQGLEDQDFIQLYREYKEFIQSRQYNVGFQFDQLQFKKLTNENALTWNFGSIDREQIYTLVNYKRFIQLEVKFRFYYQKLSSIQEKNIQYHSRRLFDQYLQRPVLASSILNMKSYLKLINNIGDHTLIIYGANRYAQGHLHSYICPNTRKIILIGDENQIDTSLYIQNNLISGHSKSHFKLISLELQKLNNQRLYLTIQNNATTDLYGIFNNFYHRINDQNKKNQEKILGVWSEIQFINHQFMEFINFRRYSISNPFEADFIQQFAKYLVNQGNEESEIFVITFSHQQKKLIKYLLSDINLRNIEVGTPQAFDGRYKKIIIVSMVRSNDKLMLGQLRNVSKLVSALTTSKQGLFVFGDFNMIDDGFDKIYNQSNNYTREVIDQYQDMMAHLHQNGRVKNYLSLKNNEQRLEISIIRDLVQINNGL